MRVNKYRGKRIDNGEWVYGGYYEHQPPLQCIDNSNEKSNYFIVQTGFADWNMSRPVEFIEVIPETVGQFTGRYDNFDIGKEIYEDDICSFNYDSFDRIEQIVYLGGSFCLGWCIPLRHAFLDSNIEVAKTIKIIGNIHDNPESIRV
jgi:hypothetical protein